MPDRTSRRRVRTTVQSRYSINRARDIGRKRVEKRLSFKSAYGAIALVVVISAIVLLTKHNSIAIIGYNTTTPSHASTGVTSKILESFPNMHNITQVMMESSMPSISPAPVITPAFIPMESMQQNETTTPEPSVIETHEDVIDTSTSATITIKPIRGNADVADFLSMRSEASASSSVTAKIPKDSDFTILQVSKNPAWLEVEYKGKLGFVLAKYVIVDNEQTNQVCTISSKTVNVRHGADKNKELIGELHDGDTLIVIDKIPTGDGLWYKVGAGELHGYINAKYCRLSQNK